MRRTRLLALALGTALTASACVDDRAPFDLPPQDARVLPAAGAAGVVVMTRNLYLGAEIMGLLEVTDPNQVPFEAAALWGEIVATDFHARAKLLADEIESVKPHLVGLNEVSLYRSQWPSNILTGTLAPDAADVEYDFLHILMEELEGRGLDYQVASYVTDHDLEVPAYAPDRPQFPFRDIRYTDHDVILRRGDVVIHDTHAQTFAAYLPVPMFGAELPLLRGWTAVDASVGMHRLLFVSTHLEVQDYAFVQVPQAQQLLAWVNQYQGTVVLTGDLNSAANPSAPAKAKTATYGLFLAAGFEDVWLRQHDADEGLTCCQLPSLLNQQSLLQERLDLVLVRHDGRITGGFQTAVVGDDPFVRTPSGLWASDHAGVAAVLRFARAGGNR